MVLAGTTEPVAFFAYPNAPSVLVPKAAPRLTWPTAARTPGRAGRARRRPGRADLGPAATRSACPTGRAARIDARTVGASIARHMPEGAIVSDELGHLRRADPVGDPRRAPPRLAGPDRRRHRPGHSARGRRSRGLPGPQGHLAERRRGGMYTVQGLWTMAREGLDVTVVDLRQPHLPHPGRRVRAHGSGEPGPAAASLLDLGNPRIDWVVLPKRHRASPPNAAKPPNASTTFRQRHGGQGPDADRGGAGLGSPSRTAAGLASLTPKTVRGECPRASRLVG